MSASIFVFITLTLIAQTLVKTLVSLCSWHVLRLGVVCSLILFTISQETSLSIFQTCSCLHDYRYGPLVSVHFQMNYLIIHLQNQRQYRDCQSPNHSKHYLKLNSLFPLLLMRCSTVENSWGLHSSVYIWYCSFPSALWHHFLTNYNAHLYDLKTLDACKRLLTVQWMVLQVPLRFSELQVRHAAKKTRYPYTIMCVRTDFFVCVWVPVLLILIA